MKEEVYTVQYFREHYASRLYRLYLKMRNACIYRAVRAYKPSGRLLEIGFGNGNLIRTFARDFECYGVDVSPVALQVLRKQVEEVDSEHFRICDVEREPIPFDGPFDVVCALNVVEHVSHPRLVFERVYRVMAPGGVFALYLPTCSNRLSRWLYRRFYDVEEHVYRPSVSALRAALRGVGFHARRELAAQLFPLFVSWEKLMEMTNLYFGIWQKV